MNRFIKFSNDILFNVSQLESIKPYQDEKGIFYAIRTKTEDELYISTEDYQALLDVVYFYKGTYEHTS